ncbi:MAG: DUF2141 domain-containing protein [Myxococcales bacterium FL481]|nr:MAG: DUF2141 domain-containing protein [Myxococcales bacterium FL481]
MPRSVPRRFACRHAHWAWLLGSIAAAASLARADTKTAVEVSVTQARNSDGHVLACLFSSASGFPGEPERAVAQAQSRIQNGKARLSFPPVPPGTYAVSVIHDENDNRKLDTNLVGIPKEGIGASNNPEPRFGPPKYDQAKFRVGAEPVRQRVRLRYF